MVLKARASTKPGLRLSKVAATVGTLLQGRADRRFIILFAFNFRCWKLDPRRPLPLLTVYDWLREDGYAIVSVADFTLSPTNSTDLLESNSVA